MYVVNKDIVESFVGNISELNKDLDPEEPIFKH